MTAGSPSNDLDTPRIWMKGVLSGSVHGSNRGLLGRFLSTGTIIPRSAPCRFAFPTAARRQDPVLNRVQARVRARS